MRDIYYTIYHVMRGKAWWFPVFFIALFISGNLNAQNCVPTGLNGSTVTSFCYESCRNVTFQVPDLRSTSSYTVISIPYAPYAFTTPGGTTDNLLYQDDSYSDIFSLPFPFCFFDQVFTQAVVSSNGLVTFDITRKQLCGSRGQAAWNITNPIPFGGLSNCGGNNYPKNSIMGVFMDLDPRLRGDDPSAPSAESSLRDRKIEWRVEGSAPCRRFVVSFFNIGVYQNFPCGIGQGINTFQIVMTESTGVIDIHIEKKQSCTSTSASGRAILGIQGDVAVTPAQALAAPGKNGNNPAWSATSESYRFVPTGGASRFVSADLLNLDHSPFATPTVANTTPGLLDLNFTNVCTPAATTDYVLRTRFSSCSDPTVFLEAYDTITFTKTKMTGTPTSTPSSCSGPNGSITITLQNGQAPYSYSLDNGPVVSVPASPFTIPGVTPGTHTVVAYGAGSCETNPISVNVADVSVFSTTASSTNALCNGAATGSITVVQPTSGTAPYEYSLDGVTWQSSNVFTGLIAGSYTVRFRESNGCQGQTTVVVGEPTALSASNAVLPVVCNGQSNGTITITAGGGIAPYQYSLDGVSWQSSNIFNVAAGTYTVMIRDNNLCTTTQPATITEPAALTASAVTTNASCNGGPDGTITVTASGGNGSYQYSLDGTTWQSSNVFNVVGGTYTVYIKDNRGCTTTLTNRVVGLNNNLTYTPPANPTICEGTSTQLQITSNALQYTWSPATGLSNAGAPNPVANPTTTTNYTVTITLGGCSVDVPVTVNVNPAPVPDAGADGFICFGQTYQLQGSGGTRFLWTPSTYLDSDTVFNPTSTPENTINYSLSVIDANGCHSLVTDEVTVDVTPPISVHTFPFDTVVYEGDQFHVLATSIATDYLWTPSVGLDDPTIPNPLVTAGPAGTVTTYKVTASTFAGCKGVGFVKVQVYKGPDIYMPTGFTPNGDGRNDVFKPFTVGIKQLNYFKIFNRWGQEIYSTKTLGAGWDGRVGGAEQGSGVYVWMVQGVTNDNKVITKRGTVALLR